MSMRQWPEPGHQLKGMPTLRCNVPTLAFGGRRPTVPLDEERCGGPETKCGGLSDKKGGTSFGNRALQVHESIRTISTALGRAG
jgi:hypothetical protein